MKFMLPSGMTICLFTLLVSTPRIVPLRDFLNFVSSRYAILFSHEKLKISYDFGRFRIPFRVKILFCHPERPGPFSQSPY